MTLNQKIFLATRYTIFWEKSPTHNKAAPKLNAWEQKIGKGGALKAPPPPDRIGLRSSTYDVTFFKLSHDLYFDFTFLGFGELQTRHARENDRLLDSDSSFSMVIHE